MIRGLTRAETRATKLERLTGRKDSVKAITPLLDPKNAEEALHMGEKIRENDKLKSVFGERPNVEPLTF